MAYGTRERCCADCGVPLLPDEWRRCIRCERERRDAQQRKAKAEQPPPKQSGHEAA